MNIYELIRNKESQFHDFIQYKWQNVNRCMLDTDLDKQQYDLLQKVIDVRVWYRLKDEEVDGKTKNDSRRVIRTKFTKENFELFDTIDKDQISESMAIMISDAIWVCNHNVEEGKKAQKGYFNLYKKNFHQQTEFPCVHYLKWSLVIAKQMNAHDVLDSCLNQVYHDLLRLQDSYEFYLVHELLHVLMHYMFDCPTYHFSCDDLQDSLCSAVDRMIEQTPHDCYSLQRLFESKEQLLRKLKKPEEANRTRLNYAKLLMRNAAAKGKCNKDYGEVIRDITTASKVFEELGEVRKRDEAMAALAEAQKSQIGNMKIVRGTRVIPEQYRDLSAKYFKYSTHDLLIELLQLIPYMEYGKLREEVITNVGVMDQFATCDICNASGKVVCRVPPVCLSDEESIEKRMYMRARKEEQFLEQILIRPIVDELIQRDDFTDDSLRFLFDFNSVIPEDRASIIGYGVYLGLIGDLYSSMHILAPQTENLFRYIRAKLGGNNTHYNYESGIQKAYSLQRIFAHEDLLEKKIGRDVLFTFNGLMQQDSGSNIRNNIAHGLWNEAECESMAGLYFVVILMKFIYTMDLQAINRRSDHAVNSLIARSDRDDDTLKRIDRMEL